MRGHRTVMVILAIFAVFLIVFAPSWGVGRGFGILLLICPIMMLFMMSGMGGHKK